MRRAARSQQGMAVVAALVIVMVATALVTGLLQRQATEVRALENEMARAQARLLMIGGVDWARLILRSDARWSTTVPQGQLWSTPIEDTRVPLDDARTAVLSGRLQDEQGKFNLRNLAEDGQPRGADVRRFARLLALLGQPEGLADLIARRIALAQVDPGAEPADAGADTAGGEARRSGRQPIAPMPVTLDDLAHMEMLDPATIDMLRPHATVLPEITQVNVNTATPEVLAAITGLPLPAMRGVAAQRDAGVWFNQPADFRTRLGHMGDVTKSLPDVVVTSNWFLVKGAVTLERAVIGTQALLRRGTGPSPDIIWTRESP